VPKERVIELRSVRWFCMSAAKYIRRLVGATALQGKRMASSIGVGASREVRGPRRVPARDHHLGTSGQSLGAAHA
jgi:hypothetical protein